MATCIFAVLAILAPRSNATAPQEPGRLAGVPLTAPGARLGAFVRYDWVPRYDYKELKHQILAREAQIGRKFDIDHHFIEWTDPIVSPIVRWDVARGRVPLVSWHGTDTLRVAAGELDGWIRAQARAVKEIGAPILLRWAWEMEGRRNQGWVRSQADFIAAWRHLREVFSEVGTDNAAWVWCPSANEFSTGLSQSYYPGDDAVDWICTDGYNWAPGIPNLAWTSFHDVFASFYAWAAPRGKPLMIAEFGAQERNPGEKAAWIWEIPATLRRDFPMVRAVVYFDTSARYDWRLGTSQSALAAFRAIARDPLFDAPSRAPPDRSGPPSIALGEPPAGVARTGWPGWLVALVMLAVAGAGVFLRSINRRHVVGP